MLNAGFGGNLVKAGKNSVNLNRIFFGKGWPGFGCRSNCFLRETKLSDVTQYHSFSLYYGWRTNESFILWDILWISFAILSKTDTYIKSAWAFHFLKIMSCSITLSVVNNIFWWFSHFSKCIWSLFLFQVFKCHIFWNIIDGPVLIIM